ncbi:hypothetical protein Pelo_16685 [Pelomyxa schiedti]|nr:hypothetical protein Pelo_16685 [Pelomyxa schiedti]
MQEPAREPEIPSNRTFHKQAMTMPMEFNCKQLAETSRNLQWKRISLLRGVDLTKLLGTPAAQVFHLTEFSSSLHLLRREHEIDIVSKTTPSRDPSSNDIGSVLSILT